MGWNWRQELEDQWVDEFDPLLYDARCRECGALFEAPAPERCLLCDGELEEQE